MTPCQAGPRASASARSRARRAGTRRARARPRRGGGELTDDTRQTRTRRAQVVPPSRPFWDYAGQLEQDGISPWRLSTGKGGK
jgi:hypothetical protein